MLLYFSQERAKSKSVVFTALVLVLLTAFMVGCKTESEDDTNIPGNLPVSMIGEWDCLGFELYTIDTDTFEYEPGYEAAYKGTIEFVSNYSNESGLIIVKYTTPPGHTIWENYVDTGKPFHVNGYDYTAVYYRNLTSSTVQLANVINLADNSSVDTLTLGEAKAKFTRSNAGKYVNWSYVQPFTKQ